MSYFSRLSDIVSCRLRDMIARESDPSAAITKIIAEIEEGLAGAQRSVTSAGNSEERLKELLEERKKQAARWGDLARQEMAADNEAAARQALMRKRETEDLAAGIEQQVAAAGSTRVHLSTTMRAIEARLAEARRILEEMQKAGVAPGSPVRTIATESFLPPTVDRAREEEIDAELEALRRELKKG